MDMRYFVILVTFVLYKKAKTVKKRIFVFDLDFILQVDLGRSYKYFFLDSWNKTL